MEVKSLSFVSQRERQRQADLDEFETSLVYIVDSKLAMVA